MLCYATEAPPDTKKSSQEDMNDQSNDMEEEEDNVKFCFLQSCRSAEGLELRNCVLLDSESSAHTFCNADLLETVWTGPGKLTLKSNGGEMTTYQQGTIRNLSMDHPVW